LQEEFLHAAGIPLAMVNILTAIPRTPLFDRLEREGRLDNSGDLSSFGTINTNVIPRLMTKQALCEGYLQLMRDLYTPEAYFARLDAMYLDAAPLPPSARTRYLRRHPRAWLKAGLRGVLEVAYIVAQLMTKVPQEELRRAYRSQLWKIIGRRPSLHLLRIYAIKCALHYHFDRLIAQMVVEQKQSYGVSTAEKEAVRA
jgi:hypothetical protein